MEQLFFKTMSGTKTVDVYVGINGKELKEEISKQIGLPPSQFKVLLSAPRVYLKDENILNQSWIDALHGQAISGNIMQSPVESKYSTPVNFNVESINSYDMYDQQDYYDGDEYDEYHSMSYYDAPQTTDKPVRRGAFGRPIVDDSVGPQLIIDGVSKGCHGGNGGWNKPELIEYNRTIQANAKNVWSKEKICQAIFEHLEGRK